MNGTRRPRVGALGLLTALACAAPEPRDAGLPSGEAAGAGPTLQEEILADMAQLADKYASLAEAMPDDAYGWRPAEGVRSVSEVFMHVASANVGIPSAVLDDAPPADHLSWHGQNAESITDRATVIEALAASFDYAARVVAATPENRLTASIELFGSDATVRQAMTLVQTHAHEHLGQSIAYARVNGIVPPWSSGG